MENNIKLLSKQTPIYVSAIFNEHINPVLVYHNLEHTRRVAKRTLKIANYYNLGTTERFILLAASWFHDTGHLFSGPQGHEQQSADIMESFLRERGYRAVYHRSGQWLYHGHQTPTAQRPFYRRLSAMPTPITWGLKSF